jgi:hypothetical protein
VHSTYTEKFQINGQIKLYTIKGFNKYSDPEFINEISNKDIICPNIKVKTDIIMVNECI